MDFLWIIFGGKERRVTWTQRWNQEGGGRELLRLAFPLILSSSFLTLQVTIDRVLLSQASSDAVAAAMPAAALYWTPFILLQCTANYATTFVAQYTGAGRRRRVGPAVWQSLYFSLVGGLAFLALIPLARPVVALGGTTATVFAVATAPPPSETGASSVVIVPAGADQDRT